MAAYRWGGADYATISPCLPWTQSNEKGYHFCSIPYSEMTLAPLYHMIREGLNMYLAWVASIAPNEETGEGRSGNLHDKKYIHSWPRR